MRRGAWRAVAFAVIGTTASSAVYWAYRHPVADSNWHQRDNDQSLARLGHALAWDAAHGYWITTGGAFREDGGTGCCVADTRTYVTGGTWVDRAPAHSPPPRFFAAMAYDARHRQLLYFGGGSSGFGGSVFSDTWKWNGTDWEELTPATHPEERMAHAMVYDGTNGSVLLFGGFNGSSWLGDTWKWNGTNWNRLAPSNSPTPRGLSALAWDRAHGYVLLHGGFDYTELSDTWKWNGTNWAQFNVTPEPIARHGHGMAYSERSGAVIVVGGVHVSDTLWHAQTWNGSAWNAQHTVNVNGLSRRNYFGLASGEGDARLLLFGGEIPTGAAGDTWEQYTTDDCGTLNLGGPHPVPMIRDHGMCTLNCSATPSDGGVTGDMLCASMAAALSLPPILACDKTFTHTCRFYYHPPGGGWIWANPIDATPLEAIYDPYYGTRLFFMPPGSIQWSTCRAPADPRGQCDQMVGGNVLHNLVCETANNWCVFVCSPIDVCGDFTGAKLACNPANHTCWIH